MSDPIYNVVIGTAGHIDHGKSSLVRHLTGVDPDRLPEERDRGLTIDLGFAPMELASGERVGIIDVPGHERFIKNMVAGASGIDLVLLLVAADDSVMPQTREHLDIMTLLGVERGMLVINKVDLVEEEMVELVAEELEELVEGTFLEGAPVFRVSALSGDGIPEFREALEAAILEIPRHTTDGVFRMPIQRVFSAKGHGTVVTGIPVSGEVRAGDRVEVLPLGSEARVRSLQAYQVPVDVARAGHSTAINLSDVDYREVHRGMIVGSPGYFRATDMIEAKVRVLDGVRAPLLHQMAIRFHTGTVEAVGKLYLLEGKSIGAGEETFAQFRLEEPIVVSPGDRYVFRQQSPMVTLGGGEILDRSAWRLKSGKEYVIELLRQKEAALGSNLDFVRSLLSESHVKVLVKSEMAARASLGDEELASILSELESSGEITPARQHGTWLCRDGIEAGRKRVLSALDDCYREASHRVYVPKLEVRNRVRLDEAFFEELMVRLSADGALELHRGGKLSLPGREIELAPDEKSAYDLLVSIFREKLFTPPRLEEIAAAQPGSISTGLLERMQVLLIDQEELLSVSTDIVLHASAIEEARTRLRSLFEEKGEFTAAEAKDALGTSRKFAIPLLEYFDRVKLTRRVGDKRELVDAG